MWRHHVFTQKRCFHKNLNILYSEEYITLAIDNVFNILFDIEDSDLSFS